MLITSTGSGTAKTMASITLDLKDTYCHFTIVCGVDIDINW